jgi:hypothetical protein
MRYKMAGKGRGKVQGNGGGANNAKKGVLTRKERLDLMAETLCDERTIRRWERGGEMTPASLQRLGEAARKLRIPIPEIRT